MLTEDRSRNSKGFTPNEGVWQ